MSSDGLNLVEDFFTRLKEARGEGRGGREGGFCKAWKHVGCSH